ncbi:hypothetical protein [Iningainema tapete]|uniref:Uncharacterized protein n=1 Tax=Iningainema tapete BLCC-T55 TaxID=2748662 RepID=A0A8J7BW28_9CYAN|nr:hypothetical protein [Iningainema tapete]MBD2771032.1 hypothetical protein [Iningainema tapete BLCC-T55]
MLRKILCLAIPITAMPFISLEIAPAVAISSDQGHISAQIRSNSTTSNSLLISQRYEREREYSQECRRRYREVYRDIQENRRNLAEADNDREYRRAQQRLERNQRRLQNISNRCDSGNRNYRDRDYRDRNYRDYRDSSPVRVPIVPPR